MNLQENNNELSSYLMHQEAESRHFEQIQDPFAINPSINYDPSASLAESSLYPFGRETLANYEGEGDGYLDQQQSSATGGAHNTIIPNFQGTSTYSNHDSYEGGGGFGRRLENIMIHNVETDSYEEEKYGGPISVVPLSIGFKGKMKDRIHLSGKGFKF